MLLFLLFLVLQLFSGFLRHMIHRLGDMTYLPGLDVVWFPNPGSPLVSRLSRLVAVSAASVVFKVSTDTSVPGLLKMTLVNMLTYYLK